MHKVLIVSFLFPPAENIGALRMGKFAKYLPQFDWDPIILTVNKVKGSKQTMTLEIDDSKIIRTPYFAFGDIFTNRLVHNEQISTSNPIQRNGIQKSRRATTKILRLAEPIYNLPVITRWLFDPMGWYNYAVKAGLEIVKKNDVDIIFSSFNPSTSHLIASRLHQQTKIPWVAEFRDPWSMNPYFKQTEPFHSFERWWERRTLKNCDYLVDVSQTLANIQEKLHSKPTLVIPNGFDEDDYLDNIPTMAKFCITYTGNMYPGKTDPSNVFRALAELNQEKIINPQEIELRFFGSNVIEILSPLVDKYGLKEYVKLFGFIPLKESIKKQKESTILLLMSWNDPKGFGTLGGKLYEYIAASKPVLALAYKGGEIDKLLRETGTGIIANEVSEIKSILIKWLEDYRNERYISSFYQPDKENIKKYTRREQARMLAELFTNIYSNTTQAKRK